MEVKPGYKQTEVGVIPEEWEVRQIGDLCDYQNGTSLEHLFNQFDGLKVISIGNYSVTGNYIDNGVYISRKHRSRVDKFLLKRNDLAMSLNDKTSVGAIIGRVLLIGQDDLFVFNQRTMRLRPRSNASPSYLHHAINAERAHSAIVGLAKPGTQIYVNTDDVIELTLPLPPLPEQRAIAEALSDVDALLGGLDRLIAKKRDLKQAAMQQLLTGQTRLPGFHGEWASHKLGYIGNFKNGLNKDSGAFGHGSPLVNLMDVFGVNAISSTSHLGLVASTKFDRDVYDLRRGDVIFIRSSVKPSGVGLTAVVECDLADAVYSGFLIRFRDDDFLDIGFKKHCFYEESFRKKVIAASSVSANTNINQNALRLVSLRLPPTRAEQTAIAGVLSEMDGELAVLEQRQAKTRALKQGMMQELLTGRTRLV